MITTPTAFILGAGASWPYGYPLGRKLFDNIVAKSTELAQQDGPALRPFPFKEHKHFWKQISGAQSKSIDAFLRGNSHVRELGKWHIASQLIACESPEDVIRPKRGDDWLSYLLNDIVCETGGLEDLLGSDIKFITFNYDRSLEQYLCSFVSNHLAKDDAEIRDVLKHLDILHIHGSLGPLLVQSPTSGREYWPNPAAVEKAANSIRIVSEAAKDDPQVERARDLIRCAKKVVFLGFGYGRENLEILGVGDENVFHGQEVIGTGSGLELGERNLITSRSKDKITPYQDLKCLDLLRRYRNFFT